jgi:hypothetical protein
MGRGNQENRRRYNDQSLVNFGLVSIHPRRGQEGREDQQIGYWGEEPSLSSRDVTCAYARAECTKSSCLSDDNEQNTVNDPEPAYPHVPRQPTSSSQHGLGDDEAKPSAKDDGVDVNDGQDVHRT